MIKHQIQNTPLSVYLENIYTTIGPSDQDTDLDLYLFLKFLKNHHRIITEI